MAASRSPEHWQLECAGLDCPGAFLLYLLRILCSSLPVTAILRGGKPRSPTTASMMNLFNLDIARSPIAPGCFEIRWLTFDRYLRSMLHLDGLIRHYLIWSVISVEISFACWSLTIGNFVNCLGFYFWCARESGFWWMSKYLNMKNDGRRYVINEGKRKQKTLSLYLL